MNLAEAREAVAELLSQVPHGASTLNVRPVGPVRAPRAGDGWVTVTTVKPGERFGPAAKATLAVFIVAGADEAQADAFVSAQAVPVLRAVLVDLVLAPTGVSVDPQVVLVGDPPVQLYALTLILTIETE